MPGIKRTVSKCHDFRTKPFSDSHSSGCFLITFDWHGFCFFINKSNTLRRCKMSLIKRDPFKDLDRLEEMFLGHNREAGFTPRVDIHEIETGVEMEVELPGLSRKDVRVETANQELRISGERKYERDKDKAHRIERRYGKFERTFHLGDDIDVSSIAAEVKDGVLRLTMKKKKEVQPKTIEVK